MGFLLGRLLWHECCSSFINIFAKENDWIFTRKTGKKLRFPCAIHLSPRRKIPAALMAKDKQAEKPAKAALKELREQAKNGVLKAQFLLAVKLANGDGVEADPKEVNNLWNDPDSQTLKAELTTRLLFAEMGKESVPMPRVSGA